MTTHEEITLELARLQRNSVQQLGRTYTDRLETCPQCLVSYGGHQHDCPELSYEREPLHEHVINTIANRSSTNGGLQMTKRIEDELLGERALMALFDCGHRLDVPGGYALQKSDDNRWQILKDGIFLGLSVESNVPVGRGGSIDAGIKRIADDLNAAVSQL